MEESQENKDQREECLMSEEDVSDAMKKLHPCILPSSAKQLQDYVREKKSRAETLEEHGTLVYYLGSFFRDVERGLWGRRAVRFGTPVRPVLGCNELAGVSAGKFSS